MKAIRDPSGDQAGSPRYAMAGSLNTTRSAPVAKSTTRSSGFVVSMKWTNASSRPLPDTFITVWNDAVPSQAFVVRIRGTVTGVVLDPRQSILKRIQPGTLAVGGPGWSLEPGAGRLTLGVTPNPANEVVTLRGAWLDGGRGGGPAAARIVIFDATGRLVRDLGVVPHGAAFAVTWDRTDQGGRRVAPGLYFAQVTAGTQRESRPVVFVP